MKPPTGSGKGGATEPSVPRFKCQECHRALVVGVESFADRLPEHATSGVHASSVQDSIMGANRMDNSFVVISKQKLSLGPGLPPHSPGTAGQHTEPSQSTRVIEGSYIMLPHPAASIYKTSSYEGGGVQLPSQNVKSSSPYSGHNSGFLSGITVLKRAFHIATSQTQVEHPLCLNCTKVLSDKMDKEIEDVTADISVYKACLQRLEEDSYNILSEIDFQKEKQKFEEEEEKLKAAIEEAVKKYAEVTSEKKSLETKSIEFKQLNERYWQEFNSFQFQLTSDQEEKDAISSMIEVSQANLDLLKCTSVLNDAFRISHDGEIGTINNFHLGCLPNVKVEWDEINAAWGQAALLLHTMAQYFIPKFQYQIKIHPMGSYSRVTDRNNNTFELFGRGQWFWRTQFDDAMKTFLTCLQEFAEFAMSLDKENNIPPDKSLNLPYKIDGDKVRGYTVVRSGNTEKNWTRALKYMLSDLKFVLHSLSVEKCPDNRMLGRREIVDGKAGKYMWMTYKEVYDTVLKVGAAIRSCGVGKGGRCGIYGANCPEWVISMQACNAHGIYCVPLYDTLGAGAVEFILCHAEVQIAFVEEKKIAEVLKIFPSSTKFLKTLVSFGNVDPEHKEKVEQNGVSIYSWEEFIQLGGEEKFELPPKEKDDVCTIMYTSGTTGDPKGVLISNKSIITIVSAVDEFLRNSNEQLREDDIYISYLPLAHIFDRVIEEVFIRHGASIGFWRGDVKLLVEDIGELKPTVFCAVPRVLDRIYGGLQDKVSGGGFLKKTLFNVAYKYKQGNMMKGSKHEEAAAIFDKLVFTKVKRRLGGRVRLILSGAAPLSRHVEEYLRVVTCSHVLQGYGLTETCAGSFVSLPNNMSMLGTVGPPVPYVEVRLESVPEMGYDALSSESPRGEICIRGDTLFSGYFKREDLTKEVLVDGWFHTGDIGEWQPDGSMKIIDRKKNIFKLSQGEYVAVENLENIFGQTPCVDSIWVYGNSFESSLVAVVNPNKQALERWAESNGVTVDFASICKDKKAKEFILGELTKTGKEKKLKGFELVRAVHLDPVPFDMERDLITPTYKKKRPQLLKHYQSVIDEMYKSMK